MYVTVKLLLWRANRERTSNDDNNFEPGYQLTITHERMNVVL